MKKIRPSEKKVLNLIHLSNKEIADKLFIDLATVKTHIHNLLRKFKVKNRTELIIKIIREICNEPADNIAVVELQNRIKEVIGE